MTAQEIVDTLAWIAVFADVRSKDESKTFARVNRGALRTIRDKASAAVEGVYALSRQEKERAAIADTHPKDGDVKQAPLVSGGGSEGNRP